MILHLRYLKKNKPQNVKKKFVMHHFLSNVIERKA